MEILAAISSLLSGIRWACVGITLPTRCIDIRLSIWILWREAVSGGGGAIHVGDRGRCHRSHELEFCHLVDD